MTINQRWRTTILLVVLCASSAWSQDEQEGPPPSSSALKPDTRPLSSAESITLGSLIGERGYVQPGFFVVQSLDSNAHLQFAGKSGLLTATALGGRLTLEKMGKRNEFGAAYQGGGIIYESNSQLNSSFHLLNLSDSISFRRATLTLSDRGGFLPGSYAGFNALSYAGAFNFGNLGNMAALNTGFVPVRGILTNAGGYQNTALAELEYRPGPRSTVTFTGAFETLSSAQKGFVSSNAAVFQTGYDRSLTARDTVAVFYSASAFRYAGVGQSMDAQFIAFSYGRRVTGRLALQLFGGPEFFSVTIPGHTDTRTLASGGASVTYRWPKTEAAISYWRGLTAGSGVLSGAQSDAVSATLSRPLTRAWSGSLGGGLHFNSGVPRPNSGTAMQTYDYWNGVANLSRRLGHFSRLSLFYSYQTQNSNQAFSSGGSNGKGFSRHIFGTAFNFDCQPKGI